MLGLVVTVDDVMFEVLDVCIVQCISSRWQAYLARGKALLATQRIYNMRNVHDE